MHVPIFTFANGTSLKNGFHAGFIGIALMYALSMSGNFNLAVQGQCDLANMMVSMERLDQYMHIASEAPEIIDDYRSPPDWPSTGQVEICELKVDD